MASPPRPRRHRPCSQGYERFLTDWKDAEPDILELLEARKRMAALGEVGVHRWDKLRANMGSEVGVRVKSVVLPL